MNILNNGIVMAPGKELDNYARARGLCRLCGQTQTHRKAGRFLKRLRNQWQPMTVQDAKSGRYMVYKGLCIQPTCYSLDDAKVKLGEKAPRRASDEASKASTRISARLPTHPTTPLKTSKAKFEKYKQSEMSSNLSYTSISNFSEAEASQGMASLVSGLTMNTHSDVPMLIDASPIHQDDFSQMHELIESFLQDPSQVTLDLSESELSDAKIASIRKAFRDERAQGRKVEVTNLILDRCKLNEIRFAYLAEVLLEETVSLSKLVARSNPLESAHGLVPLLRSSHHLKELNFAKNRLGNEGFQTVVSALVNNASTAITSLNLSNNHVWTLSDSFATLLSTNHTLITLQLENNFLRDAGVAMLARSISKNQETALQTLCLGNNAFGYSGAQALTDMLTVNDTIRALRIGSNEIGDKGVESLLGVLETNRALREISGLYANRIGSKKLIEAVESCLHERAEKFFTGASTSTRSDRIDHDSLTDITFCVDTEAEEYHSPIGPDVLVEDTIEDDSASEGKTEENLTSSASSGVSVDDELEVEDVEVDSACIFVENNEKQNIQTKVVRSSDPDEPIRSSSFCNALEAMSLSSPSQHQRLVPGSEQGFRDMATVCMKANGQEQIGFETVALPLDITDPESDGQDSGVEATDSGFEVPFDVSLLASHETHPCKEATKNANSVPSTRFELEKAIGECKKAMSENMPRFDYSKKRERAKMKKELAKLVSLRCSMPSKQELQQKISELDMALKNLQGADITSKTSRHKLESERDQLSEILAFETQAENSYSTAEKGAVGADLPPLNEISEDGHSVDSRSPPYRLTLFQAAPLSFVDQSSGQRHNFPLLNFEYESMILKESLKDAEQVGVRIEVEHEIATTDRLSAFFAQGGRRLLHLSCHGHPDWLALENGFGDMQPLFVDDLKGFIAAGGTGLDFVFVSACHSLAAGRAFVGAGVRHVLCAKQDSKFRDEACAEFARCFYRALACSRTLKQAFRMAKEAVRLSPVVKDSRVEAGKFMLLPERSDDDTFHDVHISFLDSRTRASNLDAGRPHRRRKRVPLTFVGRETEIYKVLEALRLTDLVQVYGSSGTGKSTLVAAVIDYTLQRQKAFMMEDVIWLSSYHICDNDKATTMLQQCLGILDGAKGLIKHQQDYKEIRARIVEELHGRRIILVVDARCLEGQFALQNLEIFLKDLLQMLPAKIIVIGSTPLNARVPSRTVEVGPLDHESSSLLFSRLVNSGRVPSDELAKLLSPKKSSNKASYPLKRDGIIFERIGRGLPSEIVQIAAQMSEKELLELIRIAKRPCPQVTTRIELEEEIKKKLSEESSALRHRHFLRARDLRDSIDELQGLRQHLRAPKDLTIEASSIRERLETATKTRKYDVADDLQKRLDVLEGQVRDESKAQERMKEDVFEKASERAREMKRTMKSKNVNEE